MEENYISWLKAILAGHTLTQTELAKRLGVTFAALNRWIHGRAKPRKAKVTAIRKLYNELIGYPSISEKELARALRHSKTFKKRGLWNLIAHQESLQSELLLEHTYNSTAIEGTTLNKNETKVVIFDKGIIPDKSLIEHLEVTNHAAALRQIFQKKIQGPVTETLIRSLHASLMQGLREDAGHYSKRQRIITGSNIALTHPKDIPEEMSHLIRQWQVKHRRKGILGIAQFHASFELIHPFGDGNGRIGRLLMTLQCLEKDYPPVIIENSRKAQYYDVLEYAQRKSERPFVLFLMDEMEKTHRMMQSIF